MPFALLLFVFALDKAFLIPISKQRMRARPTNIEILDRLTAIHIRKFEQSRDETKRAVIFIGSSRTIPMGHLHRRSEDPSLTAEEVSYLDTFEFETQLAVPPTDAITQLLFAHRAVASGAKPDVFVLDVSPFIYLNDDLIKRRFRKNIYANDFLLAHADAFPVEQRREVLARFLFATYRYRVRPERFAPPNVYLNDLVVAHLNNPLVFDPQNVDDFSGDVATSSEAPAGFDRFHGSTYSGYDRDMISGPILERTIEVLSGRASVILWLPPVHPYFRSQIYAQIETDERTFWTRYWSHLNEHGADELPFYNGYEMLKRCNRWHDSSHYSGACYNKLAVALLRKCLDAPTPNECKLPTGLPYE